MRGFSDRQWLVLTTLYRRAMTTREIGRRTTIPLARQALIVRAEPIPVGPVQPDHRWRLTYLGRLVVRLLMYDK